MTTHATENPLLNPWDTPYGLPPFAAIRPEHFAPALDIACAQRMQELHAIAHNSDAPTFDNTIAALDTSARLYQRIRLCFDNLTASDSPPALQAAERELAPKLAAHEASVYLDQTLFTRIEQIYLHHQESKTSELNSAQLRLLERFYLDFKLAGAQLKGADRARFASIVEQLAVLTTQFAQNVLADESQYCLELNTDEEVAGLPEWAKSGAAAAAQSRGSAARYAITLSHGVVNAFLTFSTQRALREKIYNAWASRGAVDVQRDNAAIIQQILQLRLEQAHLMGYENYAQFALADTMASQPQNVQNLLDHVWEPSKRRAASEQAALEALALKDGVTLAPWDWRFYSERLRSEHYALDDAQVKPYFSLQGMTRAMFDCADKLFGITFTAKSGIALYHPDVQLYEVHNAQQKLVGVFLADNYARPNKSGGAWMSLFRYQSGLLQATPVVINNNNFAKPPAGQDALLSFDEVRTLFHEFGHGLHGLLSNTPYERLGSTNVLQDFVELPSQLFEHWALEPQVLRQHALHVETGEPISLDLIAKLQAARVINQGYETVQYCASTLLDLKLHLLTDFEHLNVAEFESSALTQLGCPSLIAPRHRLTHFRHLFTGAYYASKYYVYLWAEVLDADAFEAFVETGNVFDPNMASRLYQHVYSAGNLVAPQLAYQNFRGRAANVDAMLKKRGLIAA